MNDKFDKWLNEFSNTPEGKVAGVGTLMYTSTFPIPTPASLLGMTLIIGALAAHGVRKLLKS
jgi:hypothetical protein